MHKLLDRCPAEHCGADFEVEQFVTTLITELGSGEDTYVSSWTVKCANGHRIDVHGKINIGGRMNFMVVSPEIIRTATTVLGPCSSCHQSIKPGEQYLMNEERHVRC